MLYENIHICPARPEVTLTSYVTLSDELALTPRRAVVICPGGGYRFRSDREAEPIAYQFMAAGHAVFILNYSVADKAADFAPLTEAALAIKYLRENSERYNISPSHIYILGFSAGGHLAASAGTLWNHPRLRAALGVDSGASPEGIGRPDGMILCYPVITAGEKCHRGSIERVSGDTELCEQTVALWSLENQVDSTTPPCFIWSTVTDKVVPVENTLLFINALQKNGISYEAHIFPTGAHGGALCNEFTCSQKSVHINKHNDIWITLALRWLADF